jgi:hypothetical protein
MYVIVPLSFVQFFATPLSMTITAYNRQKYDLLINTFRLFSLIVISTYAYLYQLDFSLFLHSFVLVSIASYLMPLLIAFKLVIKIQYD